MKLYLGNPVLVGVPLAISHQIDMRVMRALEEWAKRENVETTYEPTTDVTTGRDKIVRTACYRIPHPSHILFVDHDVLPRRNTLERLLSHEKDIVAGIYHLVQDGNIAWCLSREEPYHPLPHNDLPNNPFKVKYVGCGMMLVRYEVFQKLNWPFWKNEFAPAVKKLGEDLYFCQKAREAGFDIWVDPKVQCHHFRTVSLLDIANNYIRKEKQK